MRRVLGIGEEAPLAPPRPTPWTDRALFAFGIFVLPYFAGQLVRAWLA
jgi:hypothetical protein